MARRKRSIGNGVSLTIGVILLIASLAFGLYFLWSMYGSNFMSRKLQDEAQSQLDENWGNQPIPLVIDDYGSIQTEDPRPQLGDAAAMIRIPRFGPEYGYTIVEGVSQQDLSTGPGRYPQTQWFGERGNAAIAGHRDGRGAPFIHLDQMQTCDEIVIETQTAIYTYRVLPTEFSSESDKISRASACMKEEDAETLANKEYLPISGLEIVSPDQGWVVNPIPNDPTLAITDKTMRMLTLTTCHPRWSNAQRLIIHAALQDTVRKLPL